jgi:hypothetical protein
MHRKIILLVVAALAICLFAVAQAEEKNEKGKQQLLRSDAR